MKLLYEKFGQFAMLRAIVFGVMGIVVLLFPEFLRGAVFYVIVGYVLLLGICSIANNFIFRRKMKKSIYCGSLVAAILLVVFALISIVYIRYLIHIAPLYLGGLMLINGLIYLVFALYVNTRKQWVSVFVSLLILIGSMSTVIFTFGFEIVLTLSQVSGITLLISCSYEFVIYLNNCKSINNRMKREEIR